MENLDQAFLFVLGIGVGIWSLIAVGAIAWAAESSWKKIKAALKRKGGASVLL